MPSQLLSHAPFAAIFDLNGTLVDDSEIQRLAWQEAAGKFGIDVTDAQYFSLIAGLPQKVVLQNIFGDIAEKIGSEVVAMKQRVYQSNDFSATEVPGIREFLNDLRDNAVPLAIASSSSLKTLDFLLDTLGIREYFLTVVRSDDVERGKPAPDVFLEAARRMDFAPSKCIAFEDAKYGVQSAKSAGMICVGLSTALSSSELLSWGADLACADYTNLKFGILRALIEGRVS